MSTPNKRTYSKSTWKQTPTHFLAVPLHTNPTLRSRITAFQTHLFHPGAHPDGTKKATIRGLDKSIVIDPMRFHLTLGVMALDDEDAGIEDGQNTAGKVDTPHPNAPPPGTPIPSTSPASTSPPLTECQKPPQPPPPSSSASPEQDTTGNIDPAQPNAPPPGPSHPSTSPAPTSPPLDEHRNPPQPPRTVTTALALLRSLGPQIDAILSGGIPRPSTTGTTDVDAPELELASKLELKVAIDSLDIMRPVKLRPPKPPRRKKLPQTPTNEPDHPQPVVGGAEAGQETAAAAEGEVGQPAGSVAGDDAEGNMDGAGVDVVAGGPDPDDVWAEVMYLAPRETGEDGQKLRRIADLVNSTFRREGYIVEKRALKLHCTLLNTSKRRPARTRGQPFSYSDVLRSDALRLLGATPPEPHVVTQTILTESSTSAHPIVTSASTTTTTTSATLKSASHERTFRKAPAPVSIDFVVDQNDDMVVRVEELGLWVMGSRGPRGEYVSCGGVRFGAAGEVDEIRHQAF